MKRFLTITEINQAAGRIAEKIDNILPDGVGAVHLYGVPRGGVTAAFAVASAINLATTRSALVVDHPGEAHFAIDDIIDTGRTATRISKEHGLVVYALFDNSDSIQPPEWKVFPWERSLDGADTSAEDIPIRLLEFIGEEPGREGLKETPQRFLKAWQEYTQGYKMDPAEILKSFEDGAAGVDEMVIVKDISFSSHCEHHLAPFFGVAHVAYVPNGRVLGLSKIVRLVDIFARRLQVQERLTEQIASALETCLKPKGIAVCIEAQHTCMSHRGVNRPGSTTVTSAIRGVIKTDASARAEFLRLISK